MTRMLRQLVLDNVHGITKVNNNVTTYSKYLIPAGAQRILGSIDAVYYN